jgi:hypothetical protein
MMRNQVLDLFYKLMMAAIFSAYLVTVIDVPMVKCFMLESVGIEKTEKIG